MTHKAGQTAAPARADGMLRTLREALAKSRMSRQQLADAARISLSTLEKGLSGRRAFTLATVVRLETALGISLRSENHSLGIAASGRAAPAELGAYTRTAVSWLEGRYVTLRPSFSDSRAVYAYLTTISWDETAACLVFEETQRSDASYAQSGRVSVPHLSGHIYLVTNTLGQYRLITLSRPVAGKAMYGILSTLQAGAGSQLTPHAAPIVLLTCGKDETVAYGKIERDHPAFGKYRSMLDRAVTDAFAFLVTI